MFTNIQKVIFLHLYKTGGQTLKNIFLYQYRKKHVFNIGEKTFEEFLDFKDKNQLNAVIGHLKYGIHQFLTGEFKYVTFIREPVTRIISLYHHINGNPNDTLSMVMPLEERNDIQAFVKNINKYSPSHGNNAQTRVIAGANLGFPKNNSFDKSIRSTVNESEIYNMALHNINTSFVFVGLTEFFNESIILMKNKLEWKSLFYIKRNVRTKNEKRAILNRLST